MAKNIPQLYLDRSKTQIKGRAGLKQYLVSMMGEGQRVQLSVQLYALYAMSLSINEPICCWCL